MVRHGALDSLDVILSYLRHSECEWGRSTSPPFRTIDPSVTAVACLASNFRLQLVQLVRYKLSFKMNFYRSRIDGFSFRGGMDGLGNKTSAKL
jgi:hypothetical protein